MRSLERSLAERFKQWSSVSSLQRTITSAGSFFNVTVEQRSSITAHLHAPNRFLHHFYDHCVYIHMYIAIHMHIHELNQPLYAKLALSSFLCYPSQSALPEADDSKTHLKLGERWSSCTESPITAVLRVLFADLEAAPTVVAGAPKKQHALPALLTSLVWIPSLPYFHSSWPAVFRHPMDIGNFGTSWN